MMKTKSVSVIICSIDNNPLTVKSIPDWAEVLIADWKTDRKDIWAKSIARNIGASKAKGDILVFMDGDISFSTKFFNEVISKVEKGVVVGLKCPYHNYIISRVMAMMREDFCMLGGFCPIALALEDVELSYRAEKLGFTLKYFPTGSVYHKQHSSTDTRTFSQHVRTELMLALKYPRYFRKLPRRFIEFFYRIIKPRG